MSASPPAQEPQPIQDMGAACRSVGMTETGDWATRQLMVLEANIDDMTGEAAGYLSEKLLEDPNCLDAWLSPILMKKGRPAFTIHVLCEPEDQERFMRVMFTESTTLGVRRRCVERCALRRKTLSVSTAFGDVRVKVSEMGSDHACCHPKCFFLVIGCSHHARVTFVCCARRDWFRNMSSVHTQHAHWFRIKYRLGIELNVQTTFEAFVDVEILVFASHFVKERPHCRSDYFTPVLLGGVFFLLLL